MFLKQVKNYSQKRIMCYFNFNWKVFKVSSLLNLFAIFYQRLKYTFGIIQISSDKLIIFIQGNMNWQKHHYPSQGRPQIKKNDFSPKVPAKKILPLRKNIFAGQSAHNRSRIKLKRNNIADNQSKQRRIHINDTQVKKSALYKILQQQVAIQKARQQSELSKLKQLRKQKQDDIAIIKKEQYAIKLQIWQLKDETMNLNASIKEQQQQTLRLQQELGYSVSDSNAQSSSINAIENFGHEQ